MDTTEAGSQGYDACTDLAHRLIRDQTCDGSDPYMLHGHPNLPRIDNRMVRACFYYAVVVGPRMTTLLDNQGEGGMCRMTIDEVQAIWHTPDLLAALGTDFETLKAGHARLSSGAIPAPVVTWETLWSDEKTDMVEDAGPPGPAP